jgi:hypothetical protein
VLVEKFTAMDGMAGKEVIVSKAAIDYIYVN